MAALPFALVFISIFTHAYWNLLVKRSSNKHVFVALSKVAEVIIFGVPAIYFLSQTDFQAGMPLLLFVAAALAFLNYFFLSKAYDHSDMSLMYPISRSSVLFLPVLGYIFIDETIDSVGFLAAFMILAGTVMMHLDSFGKEGWRAVIKNLSNAGTGYALLAALTMAAYSLWDKFAIGKMQPFLYLYLYTVITAVFYGIFVLIKYSREQINEEWKLNGFRIVQVGFFNTFTYLLVLIAMMTSKVTYVSGLRQLSVVVGAFFGYRYLQERLNLPKIIGMGISLIGEGLLYFAK